MEFKKDFDIEIRKLSAQFYLDYDASTYPELLLKSERSYSCFVIKCRSYYICVPYRSNISRRNAYLFDSSARSQNSRSGLDYEKTVIITDTNKYLDPNISVVDNDEFVETIVESEKIADEITKYIDTYIEHCLGVKTLHPREFSRKYQFTTLKYFHEQLGIPENKET